MLTKTLTIEQMDEAGKGLARIATLSAVDHDGDTYAPGAFAWKDGGVQWTPLLTAHDRWGMPFGKARVYEEGDSAFAELHLNLNTQAGKDWHAALKFDLATGKSVQEWSYGYDILASSFAGDGDSRVRVLEKLDVHEVSTVVRGAGAGTATLMMKGAKNAALKEERFAGLLAELDGFAGALAKEPELLSATGRKQLGAIHGALGRALIEPDDFTEEEKAAIAAAQGVYLQSLSRRHLKR